MLVLGSDREQGFHQQKGPRGNVCPALARRTTFLLTIPTSAPHLLSHGEAPQVDHVAHCTPSLQSTLHNKAISVNSATPTAIYTAREATTTGHDATQPPTIFQNLGGGGGGEGWAIGGGVQPGVGGGVPARGRGGGVPAGGRGGEVWPGSGGRPAKGEGGGGVRVRLKVRVTELVEPVLVL